MKRRDDDYYRSLEWKGATYQMVPHQQTQSGDPLKPPGVPPGYEHPVRLNIIIGGAPRALPVSQQIPHGRVQSRTEAFDRVVHLAVGDAVLGSTTAAMRAGDIVLGTYMKNRKTRPFVAVGRDVPQERYRNY
jgi:hypothetical protein